MRGFGVLLACAGLLVLTASAAAAEAKFGIVDRDEVLQKTEQGRAAMEKLKKFKETKEAEGEKKYGPLMEQFQAKYMEFRKQAEAMKADNVLFMCRDIGDPACRKRSAASENCSSSPKRHLWLCGDVALFPPFQGKRGLKTMIHEYAHVGCPGGGTMAGEGSEVYREIRAGDKMKPNPNYPGKDPIDNADSYANFALDVAGD